MRIAILGGTGKEGRGLARRWARAGHAVRIGSRDAQRGREAAEKLRETLGEVDVSGEDNEGAARDADIVVSTLPDTSHVEILQSMLPALRGKVVVTATIAWPPGPTSKPSAAEELQSALGDDVRVVAAFQTVSAGTLRKDETQEVEDVLVFAEDDGAAEQASALVRDTGLRPVRAGGLENTRVAEALTGLLLKVNKGYGVKSTGIRITGLGDENA